MNQININQLQIPIPESVRMPFERPPQGIISWLVEGFEVGMSEPQEGNPRLILNAKLVAQAPSEVQGLAFDQTFWIGTEEDPYAQSPTTWESEAGRLVQFCDIAGFNCRGLTPSQIAQYLIRRKVLSDCQWFLVPQRLPNGQPNPKAFGQDGSPRSRVRLRWLQDGAATPALYEDQTPKGGASNGAAGPPQIAGHTPPPVAPAMHLAPPVPSRAPSMPTPQAPPPTPTPPAPSPYGAQSPTPTAPPPPAQHAAPPSAVVPPQGFPTTAPPMPGARR